jgi:cyclic beta-1,2-glucan synthetase
VIPAMLANADEVTGLLRQLELHYLRNRGANIRFALLTDFTDALEHDQPTDSALLAQACDGVSKLNQRYSSEDTSPFYLLHRERHWNPREGRWMGWERKRGKLHEFNQLLRQSEPDTTSYVTTVGDLAALRRTRYVITLDADTILQPNDARRLVATLAHPLNQATFDAHSGQVTRGFSILQPV